MKNIAVFCSTNELADTYTKPAIKFAELLAKNNYHLVWGGSNTGLMHLIASTAKKNGSKLVGVSITTFKDFIHQDADEMIIEDTLSKRKATMLERSDAIVCLVGGIGTLDEITEIIELKKQNHHSKPIVVLNTNNFYEGFITQLNKMKNEGFIHNNLDDLIIFADEPEDVIEYINNNLSKF